MSATIDDNSDLLECTRQQHPFQCFQCKVLTITRRKTPVTTDYKLGTDSRHHFLRTVMGT